MKEAICQGYIALQKNEIPIGAIIIKNGKIIAKAYNNREHSQIAINHAEIIAIKKACKKLHSWRLDDCELFVTLEPCPMCAGAILNARISKVTFGALDENHGAVTSKYHLLDDKVLNHKTDWIFEKNNECKEMLQTFFKNARKKKKTIKK